MRIPFHRAVRSAPTRPFPRRCEISFAAALVMATLLTVAACGSDPGIHYATGRSIEIHATNPVTVEKVAFTDTKGGHRVVRPRASNRELAVVKVTIVNRTSTVMPLLIQPDSAKLGDRRGERIVAVDPFGVSATTDVEVDEENLYSPLLWGEVPLERQMQVQGWMVFDVPKGLTLGSLFWDEVDEVTVDYIEYFRR